MTNPVEQYIEATNSPQAIGKRETALAFAFTWTNQGTPTGTPTVVCYDKDGNAVTGAVGGTASISGDRVIGFTVDGSKLTSWKEYYLVCIATISGSARGMYCRLLARPFP